MARGVNKVILIGHLGKAPDVRYTGNGSAVATMSVATSEQWTDKQTGAKQEHTEWHNVAVFGQVAEFIEQYAQKGDKVYIEGKLTTEKWEDQQGNQRYTTKIVVSGFQGRVEILTSRADTSGQPSQHNQPPSPRKQPAHPKNNAHSNPYAQAKQQPAPQQQDDFSDDIPF